MSVFSVQLEKVSEIGHNQLGFELKSGDGVSLDIIETNLKSVSGDFKFHFEKKKQKTGGLGMVSDISLNSSLLVVLENGFFPGKKEDFLAEFKNLCNEFGIEFITKELA